jgi:hypothetical protein
MSIHSLDCSVVMEGGLDARAVSCSIAIQWSFTTTPNYTTLLMPALIDLLKHLIVFNLKSLSVLI